MSAALPVCSVRLIKSVCFALDHAQGSSFGQHELLAGVLCMDDSAVGREDDAQTRCRSPPFWQRARRELLPPLHARCRQLFEASGAQHAQQDLIFREVAASAISCTSPACANLWGCSEADLRLLKCGRCQEAAYCCRQDLLAGRARHCHCHGVLPHLAPWWWP